MGVRAAVFEEDHQRVVAVFDRQVVAVGAQHDRAVPLERHLRLRRIWPEISRLRWLLDVVDGGATQASTCAFSPCAFSGAKRRDIPPR